jgi:hypothetical protein
MRAQQSIGTRFESAPRSLLYLLLSAAIIKMGVLLINGPSFDHDSATYIAYADAILDHGRAFGPLVWGAEAVPAFIHRFPGYPLILAGAKLFSPAHYAFVVVIFQSVLNGTATYLIFRVTERFLQSRAAALLVAGLYIFSESMVWDNSIMSDSIYASLFNIVVFGLLGHLLGCWPLTLGRSAGLAALWGYSVLTRDSGLYFTVLPIMLTIAIAIRSEGQFVGRISHFLVFAVVTSGMLGAYVMLNRYRTGEAFFSITGLENWLRAVFDMARYGYAQPFTEDDMVSRTVRETTTDYGFQAQKHFVRTLHDRCQCTPTQEQSLVFAKYLWAIWHHPIAYLRVIFVNFRGLDSVLADPVATINQLVQLGTPVRKAHYSTRILPDPSFENVMMLAHHFSVITFIQLFVTTLSKTISTIAFSLVVFGIPIVILRKWHASEAIDDRLAATSLLWLAFMTVSLAFSMVHIEPRHVLPVLPAALVCVAYMLQWLRAGLHRLRKREPIQKVAC